MNTEFGENEIANALYKIHGYWNPVGGWVEDQNAGFLDSFTTARDELLLHCRRQIECVESVSPEIFKAYVRKHQPWLLKESISQEKEGGA